MLCRDDHPARRHARRTDDAAFAARSADDAGCAAESARKILAGHRCALENPPACDWLIWRRTYDDHGFSPLKQINKTNVGDLRVAWAWSLPNGQNEATPLEHDGVLFVHSYGDKVQALNAVTGDLLWQYSRQLPKRRAARVKRNFALYGDRLFVATSDDHVVALDVKTGSVIWDSALADYTKGYQTTGGPLVAKGKVMQGLAGQSPGGNFIVALDAETGKEAWRFYSIAQPGEPGDSWNGLPPKSATALRSGPPAATIPQLEPRVLWRRSNVRHRPACCIASPGFSNDGLFTDCTLAFNPDTGKLVWYFQHVHNDQWDLDWAFEQQVIHLPAKAAAESSSSPPARWESTRAWMPRPENTFSRTISASRMSSASIDPKTGEKTINPERRRRRRQAAHDLPASRRRPQLDRQLLQSRNENPLRSDQRNPAWT